jgi:hypothetical protein
MLKSIQGQSSSGGISDEKISGIENAIRSLSNEVGSKIDKINEIT